MRTRFRDPRSGKWFLYFAADFTNDEPYGTGLAVVPLADDLVTAADKPSIVVRATCDWQIYEKDRDYKGRVWNAWHCVEGPCMVFHDDRYYCLYSGGAWHTENYGLGFAVADHPLGPWKDEMARRGPTVLKGIPKRVIGPATTRWSWARTIEPSTASTTPGTRPTPPGECISIRSSGRGRAPASMAPARNRVRSERETRSADARG
jgi:hypothetical protein